MCTVWPSHSKWLSEQSNESASNFVLSLNIPPQKLFDDPEGFWEWCNECSTSKSVAQTLQRWLRICWMWPTFWKACNKEHLRILNETQCPQNPRFGALQLLAFPKTKITFEREKVADHWWDQENMTGQLMAIPTKDFAECFEQWKRHWESCVRSQGAYFEGDWGVIFLGTMFLVSCIFFNKRLYFS